MKTIQKKKEKKLRKLIASGQNLEGDLDLSDFVELEKLDFSFNKLREIDFVSTIKHPNKLVFLDLRNNSFSSNKLEVFALFYQLEELYLGTTDLHRIFFNSYNNFYGSLKPLEDLKRLCISNTEINRGLEYLPDSLEEFSFADLREEKTREDLGLAEIMKELGFYKNDVRELKKGRKLKEEKINKLEKEFSAFGFLINTWEKKFEEENATVKQLKKEKKKLEEELKDLRKKNEEKVKKNELLLKKLEDNETKLDELEKKYLTSEKLIKEYLQDQEVKNRELEKQLSNLQEENNRKLKASVEILTKK